MPEVSEAALLRTCVAELEGLQPALLDTSHPEFSSALEKQQEWIDILQTLRLPERHWKVDGLNDAEAESLRGRLHEILYNVGQMTKMLAEELDRLQSEHQALTRSVYAARSYLDSR